jgi:pimeloyl-ACP methyl ester carboxylesterase
MPMGTTTDRVAFEGGELEYDVAGDGPGVVLLHPGLWDRRTWDDQFGVFAERYRVVRFDARGYGRSPAAEPGRAFSPARDALAVMDAVGMTTAALVGCSMGGSAAIDVALLAPERVSALVLVAAGCAGMPDFTPEEEAWWTELDAAWEAAMARGDRLEARRIQVSAWAGLGMDDPVGRRILEIAIDNIDEMGRDESDAERLEPSAYERLHEIAVPTLVMPADHDPPEMARIARTLVERIPGARLVEIAETDHVLNMRRPREFNETVLAFLDEALA